MNGMTLYDISSELYELLENGFSSDFLDEETGEIDEKKVAERIDALNIAFDEKIDDIASYIKDLSRLADGIKAEKNALAERQKRLEKRIEKLEEYSTACMRLNGKKKVVSVRNEVSFTESHPLNVLDEECVPRKFFREITESKIDKNAIKEAIKAGEEVPGVEIGTKYNLRIK